MQKAMHLRGVVVVAMSLGCDDKGEDSGGEGSGSDACPLLQATIDGVESDIVFSETNSSRMVASYDADEQTLIVAYAASSWNFYLTGFEGTTGEFGASLSVEDVDQEDVVAPVASVTVLTYSDTEVRLVGSNILATTSTGVPRTIQSVEACATILVAE